MTGHSAPTTRIVVTGSECTGKSSLARQLADWLGAPRVSEFSRIYAEEVRRPLGAADVEPIARGQIAAEDAALTSRPALLVLDTDLVSTVVYARHYYGECPPWIERTAKERLADLYLLCAIDIPWEPDGVRDEPLAREHMHELFRRQLREFGAVVKEVRGLGADRLAVARAAVTSWQAARSGPDLR